jgi:hypothetical protein
VLVDLIGDDPDDMDGDGTDWHVQQQAALALCRIYRVTEECGHVYCNRVSREQNRSVKTFWVSKIAEQSSGEFPEQCESRSDRERMGVSPGLEAVAKCPPAATGPGQNQFVVIRVRPSLLGS